MTDVTIVTTEKESGKRMELQTCRFNETELVSVDSDIIIDTETTYQKILGFGGAFTTSASFALEKVSPDLKKKAIEAYFHPDKGIGYNIGRVHIGCCDFSFEEYTLNDTPGDIDMNCFDIFHDKEWTIPLILESSKAAGQELLIYAVPWSPPPWMKSNGTLNGGGRLLPEYYKAMANYIVEFVKAYQENGIRIWGVGTQNEPDEVQRWASCCYTAEEERDFLSSSLIPALHDCGLSDIKILIWDSNKDNIYKRTKAILAEEPLYSGVDGIAFHWYSGDYFENLDAVHADFPGHMLISTESCVVLPDDLNDWQIAERYGHEIIGDLNHWANGFIDWNLFLDTKGGPNLHNNFCAAPIMADAYNNKLIFLNSYYYIGHFSKYIKRGALRVRCETENKNLEVTAFQNPGGRIVVVIMNPGNEKFMPTLRINGISIALESNEHSIQTVILNQKV